MIQAAKFFTRTSYHYLSLRLKDNVYHSFGIYSLYPKPAISRFSTFRILCMNNQDLIKITRDLLEERNLLLQDKEETKQHRLKSVRSEYGQNPGEYPSASALAIKEKYPVFFESDEEPEEDGNPNPSSEYKERQQLRNVRAYIESELKVNKSQLDQIERNYPQVFNHVNTNPTSDLTSNVNTQLISNSNSNLNTQSTSNTNAELTPNMDPNTNPYINPITNPFIGVNLSRKTKTVRFDTESSSTVQEKESSKTQTELRDSTEIKSSDYVGEEPIPKRRRIESSDSNTKGSVDDYLLEDYNPFDDIGTD